jgi:hypothetical protein
LSTQEIRDIYKKVQIAKTQTSEKVKKETEETLTATLNRVVGKYMMLLQDPKVPVSDMDEAKREMSNMLDILQMDSDHDVIMALTNNEIKRQYMEKLKNDSS